MIVTPAEKDEAIRKIRKALAEWRKRNQMPAKPDEE